MASRNGARILVVDDDQAIRIAIKRFLSKHGFRIAEAETVGQSLKLFHSFRPDLVLLDLGLPDFDGRQVIRLIREQAATPIIVLSVNADERDKVSALDQGADDYLTKPFSVNELLARVRVALRHVNLPSTSPIFLSGELEVDVEQRRVRLAGKDIELSPTEYALLKALVARADRVVTYEVLSREVWGATHPTEAHYLHVYMARLRKKLEPDPQQPRYLLSEPMVGYRLVLRDAEVGA